MRERLYSHIVNKWLMFVCFCFFGLSVILRENLDCLCVTPVLAIQQLLAVVVPCMVPTLPIILGKGALWFSVTIIGGISRDRLDLFGSFLARPRMF